jgi:myo-inositol-1(or 4)-monophosphatase
MPPTPTPGEPLAQIIEITQRAGEVAARWFGQVTARRKSDGSLASEADVATEQFLMERLARLFPGDEVCSEETPEHRCVGAGRVWSLDPVDGTHNFIAGLGVWAVSVGLIEGGVPSLGVVCVPPLGLTWAGARGEGAWLNGERLTAPSAADIQPNDLVGVNTEMPWDLGLLPGKKRNLGSASLHACWVLSGVFRAACFYKWALWDLAAALCLAGELGVEARWPGNQLLTSLSDLGAAERQGLLVLAPAGLCESLARVLQ